MFIVIDGTMGLDSVFKMRRIFEKMRSIDVPCLINFMIISSLLNASKGPTSCRFRQLKNGLSTINGNNRLKTDINYKINNSICIYVDFDEEMTFPSAEISWIVMDCPQYANQKYEYRITYSIR